MERVRSEPMGIQLMRLIYILKKVKFIVSIPVGMIASIIFIPILFFIGIIDFPFTYAKNKKVIITLMEVFVRMRRLLIILIWNKGK
jgi:hypothetical protein